MSRIDDMSMAELLEEISLNVTSDDLTFLTRECPEMLEELRRTQNLARVKGQELMLTNSSTQKIFIKYEDKLEKERIVLLTALNSQIMLENENLNSDYKKKLKENIAKCLRIIAGKNFTVATAIKRENSDWVDLAVINSVEFAKMLKRGEKLNNIGNNSTKKKRDRLDNIDSDGSLRNIVKLLLLEDIVYLCTEQEVSNMIIYQVSHNGFTTLQKTHPEKIEQLNSARDPSKIQHLIDTSEEGLDAKIDAIIKNCKYIDIDKMLLLSAYRVYELIEFEMEEAQNIQQKSINPINPVDEEAFKIYFEFLCGLFEEIQEGTEIAFVTDTEISYSLTELAKDLLRFRDNSYITKKQTRELKEKILKGEVSLEDSDDLEVSLIKFSKEEFVQVISQSEENAIYFIKQENVTSGDAIFLLNKLGKCSKRLFGVIEEKKLLDAKQILAFFEKGILNVDVISSIQSSELLEQIKHYVKVMIIELNNIVFEDSEAQSAENLEYFTKYSVLYKALNINGKTEAEILENSFQLISLLENGLNSATLERLYQYGLIPLESAADWGVNLIDMLSNNSIKPNDLKDLYSKGIITIDDIANVLTENILSYGEKMDLIFSTFDGDSKEDAHIRDVLLCLLETGDSYREQPNSRIKRIKKDPVAKSREFVTDPHSRWKLISLIDKDYSKKFLPDDIEISDGHRVFYLPNYGKVIIEKMYQKVGGNQESAYGNATYILAVDEFFKHINEIIVNNSINRSVLVQLESLDSAIKLIHTKGWGKKLKKHLGIQEPDERHSLQELEEINIAIENIVKSRIER